MSIRDIKYDALDPGVQELVFRLRRAGFETTDSGDGVTKQQSGEWDDNDLINVPHVAMSTCAEDLIYESHRLLDLLKSWGIQMASLTPANIHEPSIQASYDPVYDTAVILLTGVHDGLLKEETND